MDQFAMKTRIFMGSFALKELDKLKTKRTMIICDPFMEKSGTVRRIADPLEAGGACVSVFSEVVPDPDIHIVSKGIGALLECGPDTLIALGGGSALDTAKAVRYIYEQQYPDREKICLVAVPTTSGTGSEVTSFAVISDREKNVKFPLRDDSMLPDIALLAPELTVTVPPSITADTGMDVLTHAVEAYVSIRHCDFSDAFAEKAMKIVLEYLETAVKDGSSLEVRERLHNASCLAGVAFNSASLGLCHAMAHALGGEFHIPHGRANAMLLAHTVAFNAQTARERYLELAKVMGISETSGNIAIFQLTRKIGGLRERVGIPGKITDCGIDREDFLAAVPGMAAAALQDACLETNPRKPNQGEIEEIYRKL